MLEKHGDCIADEEEEKETSFTCNICHSPFTRKDNLKRYKVKLHDTVLKDGRNIDIQMECIVILKHQNVNHLESNHNVTCSIENHSISSELDFQNWIEKEEVRNLVYFSKQR